VARNARMVARIGGVPQARPLSHAVRPDLHARALPARLRIKPQDSGSYTFTLTKALGLLQVSGQSGP